MATGQSLPSTGAAIVACGAPTHYEGQTYDCSLIRGHSGPHRTWVEDADIENEKDLRYTDENERW